MISDRLLALVRCPACRQRLARDGASLCCEGCRARYDAPGEYADLRPHERFEEQTRYQDAALHADARHETVSPPLLSAGVRHRMLRKFLAPGPGDRVLDLGCGSGRVLVWNRPLGAYQAGIDVSPFFSLEAQRDVDLALGDLRRLPFADGAFTKAYALDVVEHLSRQALQQVLAEAARILEPGGRLFVYSHVRKNAWIAGGLRLVNRLARRLERAGLMDVSQERLRKSDHLNPLADIPDLEAVITAAGFRLARIRYYTPLLAGLVENIGVRLAEHRLARTAKEAGRAGPAASADTPDGARAARSAAKARIAQGGVVRVALGAITWLLRLDVVLWGRVRSGPFFALLAKEPRP